MTFYEEQEEEEEEEIAAWNRKVHPAAAEAAGAENEVKQLPYN